METACTNASLLYIPATSYDVCWLFPEEKAIYGDYQLKRPRAIYPCSKLRRILAFSREPGVE